MRDDRIQNTRHPNLRQHVISRFKNRTNHALPNPDISLATDRFYWGPRLQVAVTLSFQPPKGIGPRCSASGPNAATGRNSSAPTTAIVPNNRKPNVTVSSLIVPNVTGATFFRPR